MKKKNISQNISWYAKFFLELHCLVDDLDDFLEFSMFINSSLL